ncbi:hypothetical protein A2191_00055 [Candidatus Woesebacteria bacterium RIFOXYA1_FULL_38_9]|nr:MAG: hypothetical protein A2191_00055 [Candidatus Woesebacteria bacterium RIFOXYA1_FULL_38_9]
MVIFVFLIGTVIGSFLNAFIYRLPKGISILRGRSFCPNCKKTIFWYDNIPLLSFLLLGARCRSCKKKISWQYPLIEFLTGLVFVLLFYLQPQIISNLTWLGNLNPYVSLSYLFLLAFLLLAIFFIDLKHTIIPDETIFLGFTITFFILILANFDSFYSHLLAGFSAGLFLLLLHLLTFGRGMGLGDVKLAVFLGSVLGLYNSLIWLTTSFIIGGFIGLILITSKKKKLKSQVPFGPFLIIGFLITILWGNIIKQYVFGF